MKKRVMMKIGELRPELVTHFPEVLEDGVLYISEEFATVGHKCCCGCGEEVITPLNSAQWRIKKGGGEKYSLYPSIGNWKFSCRSHYWIVNNKVYDAGLFDKGDIDFVIRRDRRDKGHHIEWLNKQHEQSSEGIDDASAWTQVVQWIKKWLG